MTAFIVVNFTVKDPEKFQAYSKGAEASLAPFGGKIVRRGKAAGSLAGEATHQAVGIVEFPDLDAISAWHASEAYQKLIPLRTSGADLTITTYAVPG